MEKSVKMVTVVPKKIVKGLTKDNNRIKSYSTLPQLTSEMIDVIQKFFAEKVGFDDLPIACLSRVHRKSVSLSNPEVNVPEYLPTKANESMLIEFSMPVDMIVSVDYDSVIDTSLELSSAEDAGERELILEDFSEKLALGLGQYSEDNAEVISFVPFIDLSRCTTFAILDENFTMCPENEGMRWRTGNVAELMSYFSEN